MSEEERFDLLEMMPETTPEAMAPAWVSCIRWAIWNNDIRAQFEKETGKRWASPRNAIEAMIDDATGAPLGYIKAFVSWANTTIWGEVTGDD